MPGLIHGFKEIQKQKTDVITPKLAYKLYDTYGLDEEIISTLAMAMNLKFNEASFQNEMNEIKRRSREITAKTALQTENFENQISPTMDQFKYAYKKQNGQYVFDDLNVEIVGIIKDGKFVDAIEPNINCSVILDKTNFYSEAGGQEGDHGVIRVKGGEFWINDVKYLQNYVVHHGFLKSDTSLRIGDVGTAKIEKNRRINLMRNHTGVHLLNAALKKLDRATCQKSSKVTNGYLSFDVGVFGEKLSVNDCVKVENLINEIIKERVDVKTTEVDSGFLYSADDVTLIPGEVYPETNVRLIEIFSKNNFVSRFAHEAK